MKIDNEGAEMNGDERPWTSPSGKSNKRDIRSRLSQRRQTYTKTLEEKLQELERNGNYAEASKVLAKLEQVRGKKLEELKFVADKEHEDLLRKLSLAERDSLKILSRQLDEKTQEMEVKVKEDLAALKARHQAEEDRIETIQRERMKAKAPKFSPAVLEMREQELHLCRAKEYTSADALQKEVEELVRKERTKIVEAYEKEISATVQAVRAKHQKLQETFLAKHQQSMKKLEASYKKARDQVKVKFQTARRSAEHAHSMKRRVTDESDDLLQIAIKRCDMTLLSVMDLQNEIRTNSIFDKSPEPLPRPLSPALKNIATQPTADEGVKYRKPALPPCTKKARSNAKGTKKKKAQRKKCDCCSKVLKTDQVFSIPKDYVRSENTPGIGSFCSWHCAAEWNEKNSPVQMRWVRHLYITDARKRLGQVQLRRTESR